MTPGCPLPLFYLTSKLFPHKCRRPEAADGQLKAPPPLLTAATWLIGPRARGRNETVALPAPPFLPFSRLAKTSFFGFFEVYFWNKHPFFFPARLQACACKYSKLSLPLHSKLGKYLLAALSCVNSDRDGSSRPRVEFNLIIHLECWEMIKFFFVLIS